MNIYTKISIIILTLFIFSNTAFALSFGNMFAGRIVATKAAEVTSYEAAGYDCQVNGTTIEILSFKGPTSYFIPSGTKPRTNTTPTPGQFILGKYEGEETIICTKNEGTGDDMTTSQVSFTLTTITLFGTSKR